MGRSLEMWLCFFLASYVSLASASDVEDAFVQSNIVPEIVAIAPSSKAELKYSPEAVAALGNFLNQEDTEHDPDVSWDADPDSLYTLVMIDPDEPKTALTPEPIFLHWLVVNIPGSKVSSGALDAPGDVHAEYIHPNPALDTPHRYILLIYQQTRPKLGLIPKVEHDHRICFSVTSYVAEHQLIGPVAGNFYKVR